MTAGALVSWSSLSGRSVFIALAAERDSLNMLPDLRVSGLWLGVYAQHTSATVIACWLDDAKLELEAR